MLKPAAATAVSAAQEVNTLPCDCTDVDPRITFIEPANYTCWEQYKFGQCGMDFMKKTILEVGCATRTQALLAVWTPASCCAGHAPRARDAWGNTPAHWAARLGHVASAMATVANAWVACVAAGPSSLPAHRDVGYDTIPYDTTRYDTIQYAITTYTLQP